MVIFRPVGFPSISVYLTHRSWYLNRPITLCAWRYSALSSWWNAAPLWISMNLACVPEFSITYSLKTSLKEQVPDNLILTNMKYRIRILQCTSSGMNVDWIAVGRQRCVQVTVSYPDGWGMQDGKDLSVMQLLFHSGHVVLFGCKLERLVIDLMKI